MHKQRVSNKTQSLKITISKGGAVNNKQRKKIREVIKQLKDTSERIDQIKDDEDDSRIDIPENLQNSENYIYSESCSEVLSDAVSDINETIDSLENIL